MLNPVELDAYLHRIGHKVPCTPTLETLTAIHHGPRPASKAQGKSGRDSAQRRAKPWPMRRSDLACAGKGHNPCKRNTFGLGRTTTLRWTGLPCKQSADPALVQSAVRPPGLAGSRRRARASLYFSNAGATESPPTAQKLDRSSQAADFGRNAAARRPDSSA